MHALDECEQKLQKLVSLVMAADEALERALSSCENLGWSQDQAVIETGVTAAIGNLFDVKLLIGGILADHTKLAAVVMPTIVNAQPSKN